MENDKWKITSPCLIVGRLATFTTAGRRRGPGGSRGLQTRCGSPRGGLGGFDSHTPPPTNTRSTGKKGLLNRFCRFVLVILLVGCARLCAAQDTKPQTVSPAAPNQTSESNPKAWKEFVSRGGFFSVLLPGTPVQHTQQT